MIPRWFLETVVRLDRAGEGEPYAGLEPAGSVPHAIAAADEALSSGSVDALATRKVAGKGLAEGRAYVAAYVEYVHDAERLHDAARGEPEHRPADADGHGR